jgi:hypothetical protein
MLEKRITKYQKWLFQQKDTAALEDYLVRRILHGMRKDIKDRLDRLHNASFQHKFKFDGIIAGLQIPDQA